MNHTFGGKNLLFAGDAQAGNWEHWLYETDKATSNPTGPLATRALEILSSVDFYKVGHHGSRNATPRVVAETIRQGAAAMCSTEDGVYGSKSNEGEVPREPLIEQLTKQTRLVRSDQVEVTPPGGKAIHARVDRGALPDGFTQGALWVDLAIDGGDEAPTAKPKTKTKAPAAAKTKKPAAAKKTKKPAAKKTKPAAKPRR